MELYDETAESSSRGNVTNAWAEWICSRAEWQWFVTLTFTVNKLDAKRAVRLLRHKLKKIGFEGEYLAVAESEKWVRSHVHALIVGEFDPEALREAWTWGDVQVQEIYDRAGVSRYMADHIQRGAECSDF